ncbi:MAG: ROK family protein [Armatimonadetes bacterium]|jgi:predicted NBD/HSP70 family sugar kinase|nr:ROK family protein [Armatimonadota bacterium]
MKDLAALAKPQFVSSLHPTFAPAALADRAFLKMVDELEEPEPLVLALERGNGQVTVFTTKCFPEGHENAHLNLPYAERVVKMLLWQRGGWKVMVGGPRSVGEHIKKVYSADGARKFDFEFMGSVYENPFTVEIMNVADIPAPFEGTMTLGGHLDGCRIGFDLGASDRKVSAVIDGEPVYTEEVNWDPRGNSDPSYHYNEINTALKTAAKHMPRVDAIGGSAAGIYLNNRVRMASLFRGVPKELYDTKLAVLFSDLQKEWGGVPFDVVNDGEVTALAAAMGLNDTAVLGIALGSSEAGGYVTPGGEITTWLNELAFCPVDYDPNGGVDEWSKDTGVGAQYFSQQAVFRVAPAAGIKIDESAGLAERLKSVQDLLEANDERALKIWDLLGIYMGYGIAYYAQFYTLKHVLILGRVTSGQGGSMMLNKANEVLKAEFPELAESITLHLPDEKTRRVGQAVAAASLPIIKK